MRRFTTTASLFIAFGLTGASATAKEIWARAEPDFRKLGIDYIVCKDNPEQVICLALSCAPGSIQMISIRSASGAFVGNVRLSAAGKDFRVKFSDDYDAKISQTAGASGSRATISRDVLEALTRASRITILDAKEDNYTESYSTKGLKALVTKACF
jgi:hypothetical protein